MVNGQPDHHTLLYVTHTELTRIQHATFAWLPYVYPYSHTARNHTQALFAYSAQFTYACILSVYYRVLYVSTCYYILVLTATNRGDGVLPTYQCPSIYR